MKAGRPKGQVLKPTHKLFVQEYLRNGNNATQAYAKIYPSANLTTSRSNGSKLLADKLIKEYLRKEHERSMKESGKTKDYVMTKLFDLIDAATDDNDRQNAIKALEMINKMTGNYINKSEITIDGKGIVFNMIRTDPAPPETNDDKGSDFLLTPQGKD